VTELWLVVEQGPARELVLSYEKPLPRCNTVRTLQVLAAAVSDEARYRTSYWSHAIDGSWAKLSKCNDGEKTWKHSNLFVATVRLADTKG
jgi:hypothetical protein